jgi:uncharacterized protein (DUF4415 family)
MQYGGHDAGRFPCRRSATAKADALSEAAGDDDDNPEWTAADLARQLKAQGARPRLARPKVHVGFRLAADVVDGIKATGKGYNARVERVLRDALEQDRPGAGPDGMAARSARPVRSTKQALTLPSLT